MSSIYWKIGTTFEFAFLYPNNSSAMTIGKTSGNFALKISKNGTGNQATTGCTFSEVDATNNPGLYLYSCSGVTSFVSATGKYELEVYDTSDFTKLWGGQVVVTSDGTGAGTWGDASFTATASDGRVYDGASGVDSALVYVVNSSGVLYLRTTTTSTGVWGPVYFNTSGTYTVYVQKSGYTTTSGTITVSGSTATGPGTDLTITTSSTSSTLLTSTLMGYVQRAMQDRSGTLSDTIALEVINEAVELISMERQWDYYHTRGAINLQAAYSTGTVAINNGSTTCTLSGGTWPTWAGSAEIFVDGTWVEIESRTSGSVLVLADTWGNDSITAANYVLGQIRYTLPSDCVRISNMMQGMYWPWQKSTSAAYIENMKDQWSYQDPSVSLWAIEKNLLVIWPIPSEDKHLNLLYFRKPAQVVSGSDTVDWDATQIVLLRRAIDYVVAGRRGADSDEKVAALKVAKSNYEEALSKAYSWDKTVADPDPGMSFGWYGVDTLRGTVDPT